MKKLITLSIVSAALLMFGSPSLRADDDVKPRIQIALLLDTSNSMDGLINQAKAQLWKIVNELAMAEQNGKKADLFVALYEYGNDNLPPAEGYIRLVVPLTTDLDKVSEELFKLRTNGGSEYCGKVIDAAVRALAWSKNNNDMKAIFIAGNEPFTQGNVDYRVSCKTAIEKGVVVNTIHCGPHATGVNGKWEDGARIADGTYMHIDQNRAVAHIDAPQDKKIRELGKKLNDTYVPYGQQGEKGAERQEEQDKNAGRVSPANSAQRAVSKAQDQYTNDGWDLVDAVKNGKVKLEDIKDEDLPEEMRGMTLEEKKAHIEKKAEEREKLKKEINEQNEKRREFVEEKEKESADDQKETLGGATSDSLKKMGEKKNFKMK
ncbi:MAG: vWA domain-containing protein [Planctomycetota bacterium]|jgi:hypothetical protein